MRSRNPLTGPTRATPSKAAGGKAISQLGKPVALPDMPGSGAVTVDPDGGRRDAADRARIGTGEAPKTRLAQPAKK